MRSASFVDGSVTLKLTGSVAPSSVGQIEGGKLKSGNLKNDDWKRVNEAISRLADTKMYIDDTAGMTISEIRAKCRRLASMKDGLDVIIIDYLQLIQGSDRYKGNRVQEVTEISRSLKTLAMELKVPVIALSQLSRSVEGKGRKDNRPILSDLRESGSIEQDADIVAMLHRDDYYDREQLIEKYLSKKSNFKYEDLFFSDKQKEEFETFFKIIVDELSSYAIKKGLDDKIKFISYGKTSLIYEIGDKIIKVGKPRRCNYIPYCEYLLQPIINRNFSFDGYPIHIEITQKVKTLENTTKNRMYCENKLYEEKLEELREKLLSIGLYCKDLHFCNIGILLNDNKINYDEIGFYVVDDKVSSIESNNNLRILGKGEFVIIDLDSIYIQDIMKYKEYLKSIGCDEETLLNISSRTKCKILNK